VDRVNTGATLPEGGGGGGGDGKKVRLNWLVECTKQKFASSYIQRQQGNRLI